MTVNAHQKKSVSFQFWILAVFIGILFFTGGASRVDVQSLVFLRPLSVIICVIALLTLKRRHLSDRKGLAVGFVSLILLCILHLIPLPPSIWQNLPGREIISEVDQLAKLGEVWRPITMTPMNSWHALASFATPLAVFLIGAQLNKDDLYRLLPVILAMGMLSGLVSMIQILGDPHGSLYLYNITNHGAAVGLFANRNHAAVMLVCLFPMLSVYASIVTGNSDKKRIRQYSVMAVGIVLVPLILITGSRAAMVLSLPALLAAALLYREQSAGNVAHLNEKRFKLAAVYAVAASTLASLTFLTIFFSRAEAWDRLLTSSAGKNLRIDFWEIGLQLTWKYFPFGSGIGSFVEVYQIDEPRRYLFSSYVNHMHNDWLEIALTGGLPAMLFLLIAIIFFLRRTSDIWRRKDASKRDLKFSRLASVLILILALASITDYPLRTSIMSAVFTIACLWFTVPATIDEDRVASIQKPDKLRSKVNSRFIDFIPQFGLSKIIITLAIVIIGGWLSFSLAASGVMRSKNARAALTFVPFESTAIAVRADQLFFADPVKPLPAIGILARESLKQQAINAGALRLLGYFTDVKGQQKQALSMEDMAMKLSRREAGAQIWLIEYYAKLNDMAKTLNHYDILLTTKPESQAILFPRLSHAIEDKPIRDALLHYMQQDRAWIHEFIDYAITNNKDASSLVSLIIEANGFPENEAAHGQALKFIGRLVGEKRFADALNIYNLVPGAKISNLTNPDFDNNDRDLRFGAMGWQIPDDPNAGAGFVRQKEKGRPALSVFANSATTQTVASRLLYLKPGRYRFVAKQSKMKSGDGGYIRYQMRCPTLEMASPIWMFDADPKRIAAIIDVPPDCSAQFLDIVASGGKGQLGMEATINSIIITGWLG